MKKMFLAAALLAATATTAVAQENSYAPASGDFALEVQFNPFSEDFGTFKLDQIKGRYFMSDNDALRLGIGFGIDNSKTTADPDNQSDVWTKGSVNNFSVNLGYERHFFNYKRVDLYAGAGLGFALQSAKSTNQFKDGDEIVRKQICNEYHDQRSYTEFNIATFTGIDFYVYKGLFVGAELGIKFYTRTYPGIYTKGGYNDRYIWSDNKKTDAQNKISEISLNTYVEPALRLGWTF